MFKLALCASLLAITLAQLIEVVPQGGGYRVEYDDRSNILLLVSRDTCYIVEAPDNVYDTLIRDRHRLDETVDDIIRQIRHREGLKTISFSESRQDYHSFMEALQCRQREVAIVNYTPSTD